MRLAWFNASAYDTTLLVAALRARHHVDVIDADSAHDFVWQQARSPYDLCIYDLDAIPAHQFVFPYLVHYPGITRLRRLTLQAGRAATLERQDRLDDFVREFMFSHPGVTPPVLFDSKRIVRGSWPMIAVPLMASRMTVVAHAATAEALQADHPAARVTAITPGVEPAPGPEDEIVISLEWPVDGAPLTDALAGLASGRPVVVFDCPETADWPSVDPQDWRPRSSDAPICVTIDPRDEEHSLRLALRRLNEDADMRARLGRAARAWWRAHATVEQAAALFENVLEEARSLEPPPAPPGWPSHLLEDGSTRAREILGGFGMKPPF